MMPALRIPRSGGSWKKAGGGFSPITNGSQQLGIRAPRGKVGRPGSIRKPARWKPGQKALLEIRKYQRDGGYHIPKELFIRLARKIFN